MRLGEINGETFVINTSDGSRRRVSEMPLVLSQNAEAATAEDISSFEPAAAGMAIDVQDRIRDLEQSLLEERRALQEAEERYRVLELKYQELAQRVSPPLL